jgi:TPR repeat protein
MEAELGDIVAHNYLSIIYHLGEGVEKDEKRKLRHLLEAAIGGHPKARHNLGVIELENLRIERGMKHLIIAAKLGYDDSLNALKECYKDGIISKEDFAAALRGHQAAVDATKSPQREKAETKDF